MSLSRLVLLVVLQSFVACASGASKSELDEQVNRKCAINGGIKVYEAVRLPTDKFNEYGQINFYHPMQGENALGDDYIFIVSTTYYQKGNPEFWQSRYQIIRRKDGKLLGESISYSRRGGDMPGPWHESSYGCPEDRGDVPLLMKIFQK